MFKWEFYIINKTIFTYFIVLVYDFWLPGVSITLQRSYLGLKRHVCGHILKHADKIGSVINIKPFLMNKNLPNIYYFIEFLVAIRFLYLLIQITFNKTYLNYYYILARLDVTMLKRKCRNWFMSRVFLVKKSIKTVSRFSAVIEYSSLET